MVDFGDVFRGIAVPLIECCRNEADAFCRGGRLLSTGFLRILISWLNARRVSAEPWLCALVERHVKEKQARTRRWALRQRALHDETMKSLQQAATQLRPADSRSVDKCHGSVTTRFHVYNTSNP